MKISNFPTRLIKNQKSNKRHPRDKKKLNAMPMSTGESSNQCSQNHITHVSNLLVLLRMPLMTKNSLDDQNDENHPRIRLPDCLVINGTDARPEHHANHIENVVVKT